MTRPHRRIPPGDERRPPTTPGRAFYTVVIVTVAALIGIIASLVDWIDNADPSSALRTGAVTFSGTCFLLLALIQFALR